MAVDVPEIQTDRLYLNAFTLDDAPAVYRYARDADVARFTGWQPHRSEADARSWLRSVGSRLSLQLDAINLVWAIRKCDDRRAIGSVSFLQIDKTVGRIDYALSAAEWGNGYMTEAVRGVMGWAFGQIFTLDAIQTGCVEANAASVRVMKRVDMTFVERTPMPIPKFNNEVMDVVHYRIDRATFESGEE